jgi:hypothetical protein
MKNQKELVIALRIAIVVFALAGGAFCGYAVPFVIPMQKNLGLSFFISVARFLAFVILILAWDVTCQFCQGVSSSLSGRPMTSGSRLGF